MNKIKFNENNFIFWTDGGLGNRLLGLGSAYELAVRSGYTADVIWDLNPHCMAKFEDLFRVNYSDKIRIHNLWDWRKKNLFGTLYGDMTREKLRKYPMDIFLLKNLLKSFMKKNGLS